MSVRSHMARGLLGLTLATGSLLGSGVTQYAVAAPGMTDPLKLMSVSVSGNSAVSTPDILQAFGYHAGQTVTRNDLAAAQKRVGDLYSSHNVGVSLGEQMRFAGKGVSVKLTLAEQAPSEAKTIPLVLDKVVFVGNRAVPTSALEAATKLHAGGPVTADAVAADAQAIQTLYKGKNVGASLQPQATYPNHDQHVVLTWTIKEQKASGN